MYFDQIVVSFVILINNTSETTKKIMTVYERVCTSDTKYPAHLQKAHNCQDTKQQDGTDIIELIPDRHNLRLAWMNLSRQLTISYAVF